MGPKRKVGHLTASAIGIATGGSGLACVALLGLSAPIAVLLGVGAGWFVRRALDKATGD